MIDFIKSNLRLSIILIVLILPFIIYAVIKFIKLIYWIIAILALSFAAIYIDIFDELTNLFNFNKKINIKNN